MVFEQLFKPRWLEARPKWSFLIGIFYTTVGILSALIVFPQSVGLISIAFTSLLILPTLNRLLAIEELEEIREKKLSLRLIYRDHKDVFETYIFLFLGILVTYSLFSLILDELTIIHIFKSQLSLAGITGDAIALNYHEFFSLLLNNFKVLLVSFIFSLVYGAGAILFLTWNASVWGTIFGYIARQAAQATNQNVFVAFASLFIKVLPHTVLEVSSYLLAIIAGGIISKATIKEKLGSKKFNHVLTDGFIIFTVALLLIIFAAYVEVFVFPVFL